MLEGSDLSGRRVLVIGVSAGVGAETARVLVALGAQVVGAARDLAKARTTLASVNASAVELIELDLASLASVRACANALRTADQRLDVVIANAGVMATPKG